MTKIGYCPMGRVCTGTYFARPRNWYAHPRGKRHLALLAVNPDVTNHDVPIKVLHVSY